MVIRPTDARAFACVPHVDAFRKGDASIFVESLDATSRNQPMEGVGVAGVAGMKILPIFPEGAPSALVIPHCADDVSIRKQPARQWPLVGYPLLGMPLDVRLKRFESVQLAGHAAPPVCRGSRATASIKSSTRYKILVPH